MDARISPSEKKIAKQEEVSLETTPQADLPKVEPPKIELTNNENKLFDEDDDQATLSMSDLSIEPEEEKDTTLSGVWDHAIGTLFKLSVFHPDGMSLKLWVHYQNMDTMEQFFQWDETQFAVGELSSSYLENPRDKLSLEYLKTNPTRKLLMLWK